MANVRRAPDGRCGFSAEKRLEVVISYTGINNAAAAAEAVTDGQMRKHHA